MTDAAFAPLGDWSEAGALAGVHVLIEDREGRLLLQLRDERPGVAHPGLWSLFGGGVEDGEDLAAAAVREIAEETGLAIEPSALAPLARIVSRWSPARRRLYVFAARADARPEDVRLGEGAGFGFFTPAQAERLEMIPEFRPVLALHAAQRR